MRLIVPVVLVLFTPVAALAQNHSAPPASSNGSPDEWKQPPLVSAPDAPQAPLEQAAPQTAPTPPPSGYQPQGTQHVPYPYSPYSPPKMEEPGPEVGLMITEAAFGTLTAAGTALLTYYFLVAPLTQSGGAGFGTPIPPEIGSALFVLAFASIPVAVAQSEVSLANGSRYYYSESWPAWLSGLGIEAGVVGLFYLMGGPSNPSSAAVLELLVGTSLVLPLGQMAVINLTKQPRWKFGPAFGSVLSYDDSHGLQVGLPTPTPLTVRSASGPQLGIGLTLATGRF